MKRRKNLKKSSTRQQPTLLLTGESLNARYRVDVRGRPIWLTEAELETLCALVYAKTTGDPHAAAEPFSIHRLREEFETAAGEGTGKSLIVTMGGKYLLVVPLSEIACTTSFRKLPTGVLPRALIDSLWRSLDHFKEPPARPRRRPPPRT